VKRLERGRNVGGKVRKDELEAFRELAAVMLSYDGATLAGAMARPLPDGGLSGAAGS